MSAGFVILTLAALVLILAATLVLERERTIDLHADFVLADKRVHEADRVARHLRAENAALKAVLAHHAGHPSATVLPFKREGK